MPRRIHSTAEDKAQALSEFLRHRADGATVLTSKNEADNPTFSRFDTDGRLEGVTLAGPFEQIGVRYYGKGPGSATYISQQAEAPRTDPYHEQRAPFVVGDTPPDANKPSRLSPYALKPTLELVPNTQIGLAGGWRSITWAYAIKVDGRLFVTNVAPLYTLNVPNGTGLRITLPGGVPENVPLLVIGLTGVYATQNEAANATTVWVQKEVPTRPRVPSTTDVWGPERRIKKIPFLASQNETYLGPLGHPRLTTSTRNVGDGDEYDGHFTGYFNTLFGKSQSFTVSDYHVDHKRVYWQPSSWKAGATSWVAQFVDSEGNWREYEKQGKGARVSQTTNIVEDIPKSSKNFDSDLRDNDESGVDAPDSALDAVVSIGQSIPAAGNQSWRITRTGVDPDTQEEDESPPSPVASITVPASNIVRVSPPLGSANMIANAEASQRGIDGIPQGWLRNTFSGVAYDDSVPGVQAWSDTSDSTSTGDLIFTPKTDVASKPTAIHIAKINITSRVSGRVDYVAKQTNLDATTTSFTLASFSAVGEYEVRVRLGGIINAQAGPGEPYARLGYNPNVSKVEFFVRMFGSGGTGVRNLSGSLSNVGMFLGSAHPRKRYSVDPLTGVPVSNEHQASLSTESADLPYPANGYVYTVLNPVDSQRALLNAGTPGVYVPGNMVEYYNAYGSPVVSAHFLSGMRMPCKPNEQRTISAYLYWAGVSVASTPLRLVVKNSSGKVVQDLGGFVESVTGDSYDDSGADENGYIRKPITFVSAPDAAWIEIISGGVGDGLWRIMGIQNEAGAVMTEFSDDYVAFGSLVSTFDLAVPGVPDGEFETVSNISRIVGFGADVTHVFDSGNQITGHTVSMRWKHKDDATYGEWISDIADLDMPLTSEHMVQIGTILNTTDIEETPVLNSHYLDFERTTDSLSPAIGMLCRSDGTEFDGTCLVYEFPNIRRERPLLSETFADNSTGFAEMGDSQFWARGWGIQALLNSTAEEIMALVGEGLEVDDDGDEEAATFIVEIYGERYRLRVLNIDMVSETREAYMPIAGSNQYRWLIDASDLEGELISREPF